SSSAITGSLCHSEAGEYSHLSVVHRIGKRTRSASCGFISANVSDDSILHPIPRMRNEKTLAHISDHSDDLVHQNSKGQRFFWNIWAGGHVEHADYGPRTSRVAKKTTASGLSVSSSASNLLKTRKRAGARYCGTIFIISLTMSDDFL